MRDHAGYSVNLSYNAKSRVTQVSETGSSNTAGQKYTIAYNSDNTNEFRFSGANDTYGDSDDVINTCVFDEKGGYYDSDGTILEISYRKYYLRMPLEKEYLKIA